MRINFQKLIKNPKAFVKSFTRKEFDTLMDKLDDAFHNKMKPLVDDNTYDLLLDIYMDRYPRSKRREKVGHRLGNKKEEVKLSTPMPSLTKAKAGSRRLTLFLTGDLCVLSDKLDGISLKADYVKGKLTQIFTRGNGVLGKDVSHIIPFCKLPKKLSKRLDISVRLEAVIAQKTFNSKFSKKSGGDYSAARNFVGGQINSPTKALKRVDMKVFEIIEGKGSEKPLSKQLSMLMNLGFDVVFHGTVVPTEESLSRYYAARIKASPYEIDGIVVARDISYKRTAKNPKHAVAYKENSEADMKIVTVQRVEYDVGRTGKITPRVFYKKTELGGVINDKATGHNIGYIINGYSKDAEAAAKKMGIKLKKTPIGPGAKIKIVRSGKVIPYIVSVEKPAKSGKPQLPEINYTITGVEAYYAGDGAGGTADLKRIAHFFNVIGIDGLKLTTVKRLAANGLDSIEAIMNASVEDFLAIDKIGEKKARGWHSQIKEKTKTLNWPTVAYASSVFPNFALSRLEAIFENYPKIHHDFKKKALVQKKVEMLEGFKELASVFAENLPKLIRFIRKHDLKVKRKKKVKASGSSMSGFNVTMTGVRDDAITQFVIDQGGVIQNMRANTNLLVIKDSSFTSSKVDKAEEKGIPVMTVEEFRNKYGI
tara:strand:- start:720 stop:2669 length:1950 start_codon:yes stop_codon:yes gene_type:complete